MRALTVRSRAFQVEKRVSSVRKSPRESADQPVLLQRTPATAALKTHAECLAELCAVIDNVLAQELRLNAAVKEVEKFKQKAFVLQELLEFQRDAVPDPQVRLEAIRKGYGAVERAMEQLPPPRDPTDLAARVHALETTNAALEEQVCAHARTLLRGF